MFPQEMNKPQDTKGSRARLLGGCSCRARVGLLPPAAQLEMAARGPGDSPLERFWLPPPPSVAALPAIRSSLSSFPSPPLRVSRVGQLDAALLDHELEGILGGPVSKALAMIVRPCFACSRGRGGGADAGLGGQNPGRRSWEPEMTALLRIAVLKMSLYDRGATYGSGLQNLKYRNEWKHGDGRELLPWSSFLAPLTPSMQFNRPQWTRPFCRCRKPPT